MTPTYPITVIRNRGWYGAARALALFAETPSGRVRLGKVRHGKSVEVQVPQDATKIYGKMDWCKSVKMDLAFVGEGDTIYANLWFTLNPFRLMGIPTMPCKFESVPR